jgi:hypothetical protein
MVTSLTAGGNHRKGRMLRNFTAAGFDEELNSGSLYYGTMKEW